MIVLAHIKLFIFSIHLLRSTEAMGRVLIMMILSTSGVDHKEVEVERLVYHSKRVEV
jgi:hypothetical protein